MNRYLALLPVMALAACSWENYPEAGREVDRHGNFGYATANNAGIQTGEKTYTLNLAHRFSNEVTTTVNFDFNSTRLDENARTTLRQQADWIRQFPEVRFRVFGHADAVGSKSYNYALGKRRAQAIVSYLASQGIGRDRLEALVSRGETQPLIVTEGRERRNRRTVTEVSGFVKRHPTVMDGKYAEIVYRDYVASGQAETVLTGLSTDSQE